MGYVREVLEKVKAQNAGEPTFLQAVTEVFDSLEPVLGANIAGFVKVADSMIDQGVV